MFHAAAAAATGIETLVFPAAAAAPAAGPRDELRKELED